MKFYARLLAGLALALTIFAVQAPVQSAATLDRAVCSTADKAGGASSTLCDGQELIDSATQEINHAYDMGIQILGSVTGTNTITASTVPALPSLVDGQSFYIKPNASITGSATLAINGLPAKTITDAAGGALASGAMVNTSIYLIRYYAANDQFRVMSVLGSGYALLSAPNTFTANQTISRADPSFKLKNTGDTVGAYLQDTYTTLAIGMYNPTGSTASGIAANTQRGVLGIDPSGKVGSLTSTAAVDAAVSPVYRSIFDDGSGNADFAGTVDANAYTVNGTNLTAIYQPLDSDLTCLAANTTLGIYVNTGVGTCASRTITGTANEITITNGNGVSGAPTASLPSALTFTGKTVTGGTFNSGAFNGTLGATTPSTIAASTVTASGQYTSTLANGTAPFVVASSTNVANLNASSLNGATFASPGAIGGTTPAAGTFTQVTDTGLAASSAVQTDSGKNLTTISNTGTGANVLSTSPGLTGPVISSGAQFVGATSGITTLVPNAIAGTTSLILPPANDTLVGKATTDTLTNKTISGASNTLSNIGNASLTNSATTVNSQTCTLGSTCTVTVPVSTGVTGLGTGVATALGVNVGSAGAPVLFNGALGTPSSGNGSNLTNLAAGNLTGTLQAGQFPALTGDVTTTAGSLNATIVANAVTTGKINAAAVTYAKIQNVAANSILGNNTGSPASAIELTASQVKALIAVSLTSDVGGTLQAAQFPALTGDCTTSAGNLATTCNSLGGKTASASATANTLALRDANANASANSFLPGYASTVTAAGTTTLTCASPQVQYFTGSTTQTVALAVVSGSGCALGQNWILVNKSSGTVTVNSSGGNLVQSLTAGTAVKVTIVSLTGTSATSWDNTDPGGSGGGGGGSVTSVTCGTGLSGGTFTTSGTCDLNGTTAAAALDVATTSLKGVMSATDKVKLNNARETLTANRTYYVGTNIPTPTISIASPAVVSSTAHGLSAGAAVVFSVPQKAAAATISAANPAVVTMANSFAAGQPVTIAMTGSMYGIVQGTTYYVIATGLSGSSFQISATVGGAAISTVAPTATFTNGSANIGITTASTYLNVGQIVRFANSGGALPTNFASGTDYYVLTVNTTTITVSATNGGSAISAGSAGTGTQTLVQQGTHYVSSVGALPTGITEGTIYYVSTASLGSNSFTLADTQAHALAGTNAINTTGSVTGSPIYNAYTGSDSNDGLSNTASGAFLTLQKSWNSAASLDLGIYATTVQISDGTHTDNLSMNKPLIGGSGVTFQGNSSLPSNVVISTTSVSAIAQNVPLTSTVSLKDVELRTTTSGSEIIMNYSGTIALSNIRFGSCAGYQINQEAQGGVVRFDGNSFITGGATLHYWAQEGIIQQGGQTVTIFGTPAFGFAFAGAYHGELNAPSNTYVGSVTGQRYNGQVLAAIISGGGGANYYPGNSAGSVSGGSQYN